MTRIIATFHEASFASARRELEALGGTVASLSNTSALCEFPLSFDEVASQARTGGLIFIRDLVPIDQSIRFEHELAANTENIDLIVNSALDLCRGWTGPVAINTRVASDSDRSFKKKIFEILTEKLSSFGIELNRKSPKFVVSIYLTDLDAFLGVSKTDDLLTSWSGGEVRYRHDEMQMVSRAELKLVEAMEVLKFLPLSSAPILDLGAAPGGWTRVLAEKHYEVVAVDPAELDSRVTKLRGVTHEHVTAERFLKSYTGELFGAIVNDMRMEPRESAKIMLDCESLLRPGAMALITLKLEKQSAEMIAKIVNEAREILSEKYEVIACRQLFHNRSEVSAVLRKRKMEAK